MDEQVFYDHAGEKLLSSAGDSERKALKHFDYFFGNWCKQERITTSLRGSDIPYRGIPDEEKSEKEIFEFWDKMIGSFITYMGKHARHRCNPKGDRLSMNSIDSYSSAVKMYFSRKFRTETPIPIFCQENWSQMRERLKSLNREAQRPEGYKPPKSETSSSTRSDREAIATACIWMGTPEFAEFWHLSNTSFHCAGRGSEVSLIKAECTVPKEVNELTYRYDVVSVMFQRFKGGPFQTLGIFPHRDGVFEDFYFSLIHLLVVKGCDNEYVTPTFAKAALHTKKEGESDSKVSKVWDRFFKSILSTFEELVDEVNEALASHSNRRGSNQTMAECSALNGYAPIFRSGMRSKSIHTVFNYIFGSSTMIQEAGKSLSMWTTKIGNTLMGGQPPCFDDIDTDPETLKKFTDTLFEDDVEKRWHPKVRELLVMTLLLRYDQFVDVLQSHPYAKIGMDENEIRPDEAPVSLDERLVCSSVRDNPFICRVNQALEKACGTEMFHNWIKESQKAFLSRNAPSLPIEIFPLYSGDATGREILIDPRCFVDHVNAIASIVQVNHMELQRHRHMLNDIRNAFNVESKITSTFIVEKLLRMDKTIHRLETHLLGDIPPPHSEMKTKGVIRFTINSKRLSRNACLTEVATAFFVDDYIAGYALDQKSPAWDELDVTGKKKVSRWFSTIKQAVRVVLLHSDKFPEEGDKEKFKSVFGMATERIRATIFRDGSRYDGQLTVYTLEKLVRQNPLNPELTLPLNMPLSMKEFFKK